MIVATPTRVGATCDRIGSTYAPIGGTFAQIAGSNGSRQFVSFEGRLPERALRNLPIWSGA